jgi:hypothetical protein
MVEKAVDAVEWRSQTVWLEAPLMINVAKLVDKTSMQLENNDSSLLACTMHMQACRRYAVDKSSSTVALRCAGTGAAFGSSTSVTTNRALLIDRALMAISSASYSNGGMSESCSMMSAEASPAIVAGQIHLALPSRHVIRRLILTLPSTAIDLTDALPC